LDHLRLKSAGTDESRSTPFSILDQVGHESRVQPISGVENISATASKNSLSSSASSSASVIEDCAVLDSDFQVSDDFHEPKCPKLPRAPAHLGITSQPSLSCHFPPIPQDLQVLISSESNPPTTTRQFRQSQSISPSLDSNSSDIIIQPISRASSTFLDSSTSSTSSASSETNPDLFWEKFRSSSRYTTNKDGFKTKLPSAPAPDPEVSSSSSRSSPASSKKLGKFNQVQPSSPRISTRTTRNSSKNSR